MAARTVGAASDPTDVPAFMVSLARSAREVRAHPRFYVDTVCYDSRLSSFQLSLYRYDRGLLVLVLAWYFSGKTQRVLKQCTWELHFFFTA